MPLFNESVPKELYDDLSEKYDILFEKYHEAVTTIATMRQNGFSIKAPMTAQAGPPPVEVQALRRAERPVADAAVEALTQDMVKAGKSESAARAEAQRLLGEASSNFVHSS